jgi:hypothetical protein
LTGGPFGLGLAILIGASLGARAEKFDSAGDVVLPGQARFQLKSEEE